MTIHAAAVQKTAWPHDPPAAGLAVHHCDLDAPGGELSGLLSADERARADRFHFERDRRRFIRGRAFMRSILAQETGIAPSAVQLGTEQNGKPAWLSAGRSVPWFNLSHSGPCAMLAISWTGPVGVDIEQLDRRVDAMALGTHCFRPEEIAVLSALDGDDRHRRFFAFWTAKEARMKLTGEGMSLAPRSIALRLSDGWPTGYARPVTPAADLAFVETPFPDTICCLATNAN